MSEEERFHTIEEVAERLRVSDRTVRRWIESGGLRAYKPGGEWRVRTSDLDAFLEARSSPKAQAPSPPETSEEERRIQYLRSYRTLLTRLANRWQRQAKTMNYSPDWLLELFDTYNDTAEALEGAKLGRDKSLYATEEERLEAGEVFEALLHLDTIVEEAARRQDEEYEKLVSETQEQDELQERREQKQDELQKLQKRREQEQDELQKRREVKAAKAQKFPQRAKASERLQSPA